MIQANGIKALGAIGPTAISAAPTIMKASEKRWLAIHSIHALGRIGAAKSRKILINALSQQSDEVKGAAIEALSIIGVSQPDDVAVLIDVLIEIDDRLQGDRFRILNKDSHRLRKSTITLIGHSGPASTPATPLLVKFLKRGPKDTLADLRLKRTIIEALGAMGAAATGAIERLETIYQDPKYYPKQLGQLILDALHQIRNPPLF
jgi:HEAT repeat protein